MIVKVADLTPSAMHSSSHAAESRPRNTLPDVGNTSYACMHKLHVDIHTSFGMFATSSSSA